MYRERDVCMYIYIYIYSLCLPVPLSPLSPSVSTDTVAGPPLTGSCPAWAQVSVGG